MIEVSNQIRMGLNNWWAAEVGNYFIGSLGVMNRNFQVELSKRADNYGNAPYTTHAQYMFANGQNQTINLSINVNPVSADTRGQLNQYWDSTLGLTAGKRLMCLSSNSQCDVIEVRPDGSFAKELNTSGNSKAYPCKAFAETDDCIFFIDNFVTLTLGNSDADTRVLMYHKANKTITSLFNSNQGDVGGTYYYDGNYGGFHVFTSAGIDSKNTGILIVDVQGQRAKWLATAFNRNDPAYHAFNFTTSRLSNNGQRRQHYRIASAPTAGQQFRVDRLTYPANVNWSTIVGDVLNDSVTLVGAPTDFAPVTRSGAESAGKIVYRQTMFKVGSDEFITFTPIFTNMTAGDVRTFRDNYFTHVFKVDPADETKLIYVSKVKHDSTVVALHQYSNGRDILITTVDWQVYKLTWNQQLGTFTKSDFVLASRCNGQTNIGLSKDDTVYMSWYDSSSAYYQMIYWRFDNAGVISAQFEQPDGLYYNGTPLETNVLLNVVDAYGTRIVKDIRLTLTGCDFKSGGKVKTVQSLDSGVLVVPVVINGANPISVRADVA